VNKVIADGDAVLKRLKEVKPTEDVQTFYDISIDEDGVPYSSGNVNDVYDDAYNNGTQNGEYDLAKKIYRILHGEIVK
jgi:TolA-binding protein